jgi:uncharacterized protein (TIGR00375 family)
MRHFFADFHVHVGRTTEGKAVKITASRELTFAAALEECHRRKGIDIVGIVDCASTGVIRDIERLIDEGSLSELPEGGLIHRHHVLVVLGAEVECVEDDGGLSHHIGYFPYLRQLKEFSQIMRRYIKNIELSSQSCGIPARELRAVINATGGIYVPAHAFTPHKSVYGRAATRLRHLFGDEQFLDIAALELGLSADSEIADHIGELADVTFLSNSDAHSTAKIGREYNILELQEANFREIVQAFRSSDGRRVIANFGLDPRLGRYHRSFCVACNALAAAPPPVLKCEKCGESGRKFVTGVLDRVVSIADYPESRHPLDRPPYHYQVPLGFVPGLNERVLLRLLEHFGSEMAVLHLAEKKELSTIVGWQLASDIILAREGSLELTSGGGGSHGRVKGVKTECEQLTFSF